MKKEKISMNMNLDVDNMVEYGCYPNQKHVTVLKRKPCGTFCVIESDDMCTAMRELNGAEYKLYTYLAANVSGRRLALSSRHVEWVCGISHTTYDRAVAGLVEKGYLWPMKDAVTCERCERRGACRGDSCARELCFTTKPRRLIEEDGRTLAKWAAECQKSNMR